MTRPSGQWLCTDAEREAPKAPDSALAELALGALLGRRPLPRQRRPSMRATRRRRSRRHAAAGRTRRRRAVLRLSGRPSSCGNGTLTQLVRWWGRRYGRPDSTADHRSGTDAEGASPVNETRASSPSRA